MCAGLLPLSLSSSCMCMHAALCYLSPRPALCSPGCPRPLHADHACVCAVRLLFVMCVSARCHVYVRTSVLCVRSLCSLCAHVCFLHAAVAVGLASLSKQDLR